MSVGQNRAQAEHPYVASPPRVEQMVHMWYDEVKDFNSSHVGSFVFGADWAHYSQVAWHDSKEVGCGFIQYRISGSTVRELLVCNYGEAANEEGEQVYKSGATAADCPNGDTDGLCDW